MSRAVGSRRSGLLLPVIACLGWSLGLAATAQELPLGAPAEPDAAAEEAAPLEAETSAVLTGDASDRDLQRRLQRIFGNLSGLREVGVEVGAGVVRLTGSVPGPEAREQAKAIVRRQEGVLAVDDQLRVSQSLRGRLGPVWEKLRARGLDLLATLPLFLVALLIVGLGWAAARVVDRWKGPFRRVSHNPFAQDLARQLARAVIFVGALVVALEVLDATALVGAVLGTAGVVGLALGFAFKDLAENTIASVLLSLRQPFAPGDLVTVGEHEGKVIRLTSRATILMTLDGNHLRIPNAVVFKSVILNATRNPQRRFEVRLGLATDEDVEEARRVGEAALAEMPGVLRAPPPSSETVELGESAVLLAFYGWVDQREVDFLKARSAAVRLVKEALEGAGMDLPEPIYRVRLEGGAVEPEERPRVARRSPARPARPVAPEALAPDRHLDRQIEAERAAPETEDLLRSSGREE